MEYNVSRQDVVTIHCMRDKWLCRRQAYSSSWLSQCDTVTICRSCTTIYYTYNAYLSKGSFCVLFTWHQFNFQKHMTILQHSLRVHWRHSFWFPKDLITAKESYIWSLNLSRWLYHHSSHSLQIQSEKLLRINYSVQAEIRQRREINI